LSRHHQELDFFAGKQKVSLLWPSCAQSPDSLPRLADFNEDFSAFHAGTLKEQAEYLADCVRYVLSLYEDQGELAPSSVIVLAHSMGGIAARHMFLQPDFSAETVKTLVTLSTPHALPPATFDRGVEEIYSRTNEFWRESYANSSGPLQDLLVISIAGGMADTMISSDYADISNLVPESHGFGVMTSSVPDLFSPVDHLAMMWCDQLRQHIVRGLIQSTDSQQVSRARPLEERLATMQCQLLGDLALPSSPATILRQITFSRKDLQGPMHTVSLPQGTAVHDQLFFMSGATPKQDATVFQSTSTEDSVNVEYFMCEAAVDIMICHQLEAPIRTQIPKSGTAAKGSAPPLYHTELVLPESNDVLLLKISKPLEGMLLANFRPAEIEDLRSFSGVSRKPKASKHVLTSCPGMSLADWTSTTDDDSMVSAGGSRFRFPNLDSSLVVYKLNIRSAACELHMSRRVSCTDIFACSSGEPTFPPVVRAYTASLREGFYFSGDTEATRLHLHTGAPYSDVKTDGLHLQSWADPACPVNLRLSIDLKASLGTLVIRYRSIMASWPTFVTLGMLRRILSPWKGSRTNINASTMQDALQQYLLEDLPLWTGLAVLSGLAQAVLSDRETFSSYSSTLLLGTKHLLFLLLVPVFLAVAISAIVVSHLLLRVIFPSVRLLSANGPNIPVLRREYVSKHSPEV
jgi:glycosylphosphatidylinositol deacylase